MTRKFWPILDLDFDSTESDVRRAYAARLREDGLDVDASRFQALRDEFEAALRSARSSSPVRLSPAVGARATSVRNDVVTDEIERALRDDDLVRACRAFDLARASSDIGFAAETEIALRLAQGWLTNETLDLATLTAIVRHYHWDDAVSGFPLGQAIFARLREMTPRPGERFRGQWNWGAFCLTPFWLIAHGLKARGIRLLVGGAIVLILPFGPLALLWVAISYGLKGNALAIAHRRFVSDEQFAAVQNKWRAMGLSILPIAALFVFVLLFASLASLEH
jgi:hypothetical protein